MNATSATIATPPAPEKVGSIFQSVPLRVRACWLAYRHVRALSTLPDSSLPQFEALRKACWETGLRTGYFLLDHCLVGWVGYPRERRFSMGPSSRPLQPETHVELAHYLNIYGKNP